MFDNLIRTGQKPTGAESLAFFRIVFGMLMLVAELRFVSKGWISDFYVKPQFFFPFYGFEWIKPLPEPYMHWVFFALILFSILITIGLFYRFSIISFFIAFTYIELIDKSVYLNHYYQVSLLAFLMCWLPMNAIYSIDNQLFKSSNARQVPSWMLWSLRLQVGLVYFFGGIAKLRYDWLFEAQPLRIWLSANQDFPIVGALLTEKWVAYALAWFAMVFDLSAIFLLSWKRSRIHIYAVIVIFHVLTHFLFYIGMFPWMMIFTALIFFSPEFHRTLLRTALGAPCDTIVRVGSFAMKPYFVALLAVFFGSQLLMPFRSYAYPGDVLWHEQGFRFSWNIMLMEKNASLEYEVKMRDTGQSFTVKPDKFLTRIQARQCSFQPDMILQFAHMLHQYYLENGVGETEIRAVCYASVNGHASRLLIDPTIDLVAQQDGFAPKDWIMQYRE